MKETLVSSLFELEYLLLRKIKGHIKLDILSTLIGNIEGTFNGESFKIKFKKNKYLLMFIFNKEALILEEVIPILNKVMANEGPIIKYNLITNKKDQPMTIIEWDINNPQKRIKKIVDGKAYSNDIKIYNLVVYNSEKKTVL